MQRRVGRRSGGCFIEAPRNRRTARTRGRHQGMAEGQSDSRDSRQEPNVSTTAMIRESDKPERTISEISRRNISDALVLNQINWSGRFEEQQFLARLYD